ncbi:MAG: hypothetical protein DME85_10485 [Verrucomicrobia bacterium]|nr:MAG: hypothetical protein DME85_10485 [Verrucomicrobiota bacterium]
MSPKGIENGRGWLFNRHKVSLDIFWLRDESLEESDNPPDPDVLAQEIVEDLIILRTQNSRVSTASRL